MVGIDRNWGSSRRGLTLADPRGRVQQAARRGRPPTVGSLAASRGRPQQVQVQRQPQQQQASTGNPFADQARNLLAGPAIEPDEGGKGLGEEFFGTAFGKGLGAVLNNPVVKNVLKPLDVLGVPGRAVVSTIQETKDAVLDGEGFSPQDWYDQINPFQAIHGENAEDSIGFGDVIADAGGTGNRYADAALGFLGDVVTDPLTYVAGLGVADKAFDAGRMGSRFASKADDAAKAAGTTRSLTGKGTRLERVAAANQKLNSGVFDRATKVQIDAAKDELQKVGVRGLSYKSPGLDSDVSRLVRDALGTGDAGLRFRGGVPFVPQGKFNVQVPGTQRPAQALSNAMGKVRAGRNESALGQRAIGYTAPVDLENASRVILGGAPGPEGVDAARAFDLATETVESIARERPAAGRYLNDGQRAINKQRKGIKREIKQKFGGDSEAYIAHAEKNGGTQLNALFDYLGGDLANRFGVTVPNLGGDLNYVGHVWNPQFLRKVSRNKAMQDKFNARFGAAGPDLLKESGRMEKRSYKINEGQTVAEVNAELAAEFPEISGKALQTDPIRILDDYVQAVSEDVGRRVGRADMNAAGSSSVRYDVENIFDDPQRRATAVEKNVRDWEAQNGRPADDGIRNMLGRQVDQAFNRESKKQIKESAIERTMADMRRDGSAASNPADDYRELNDLFDTDAYEPVDLAIIAQPEMADQIRERFTSGSDAATAVDMQIKRWADTSGNTHMLLDPQFNAMRQNLLREIVNAGLPGRTFNKLTNFFKTYATLTPGFHVRNGMSALFMNAADGVPFVTSLRGIDLWGDYERAFRKAMKDFPDDPARQIRAGDAWYNQQEKGVQKAFDAVVGSGAGGRFAESGFAEGAGKYTGKITENAATRLSQRIGASVEGRARMGMALDSIGKGASVQDAIDRITRVQFDYSQVSRLDAGAKRFFPFWSFMSRNLPLQLMQQWSRPAMYSNYEHFKDNFANPEALADLDGEVPDYIQDGGGMPLDLGPFNWFEPDLPHTRLNEDIEALSEIGSNPAKMLSNLNPVISAPLEYTFGKDAYTGRTYDDTDIRPINWLSPNDLMAIVPGAILGGNLSQGPDGTWFITDKLANSVGALSPATSRADRIMGGAGGERGWETVARNFGGPVRTVTQTQIDNQAKSEYFDERERREIERILAGG